MEGSITKSVKGEGFDVAKAGYGRAVLIGFPSVGKSTLLSKVTNTESAAAGKNYIITLSLSSFLEVSKKRLTDASCII